MKLDTYTLSAPAESQVRIRVERTTAFMQKSCRFQEQHSICTTAYTIQHIQAVSPMPMEPSVV